MAAEIRNEQKRPLLAPWALVAGWIIGPTAWALHLLASYAIIPWVCESGDYWTLHLITLLTFLGAIAGVLLNWKQWRASHQARTKGATLSRTRFMSISALIINVASALIIAAEGIPNFILSACL